MNFWEWLDRNGFGVSFLIIVALCFGFGTCGDGKGCHVSCDPGVSCSTRTSPDGGL